MKRVIVIPIIALIFLLGCSINKENTQNKSEINQNQNKNEIFAKFIDRDDLKVIFQRLKVYGRWILLIKKKKLSQWDFLKL